eukprot:TRINITY_DN53944_c0_g1_i1.p1 TRINITY_DN53944_c0_g1~~TRINITY_DN53944_c0_g1_i1.p1  ORF type:complete len:225 (-),score=24.24 TRINITY_DN53944_c0_g1_i1:29-646(-)
MHPVRVPLTWHVYSLSWRVESVWMNAIAGEACYWLGNSSRSLTASRLESDRFDVLTTPIKERGWHLSYFGGPEAVQHKLHSFWAEHWSLRLPPFTELEFIRSGIRWGFYPTRQPDLSLLPVPSGSMSMPRQVSRRLDVKRCWMDPLTSCNAFVETGDSSDLPATVPRKCWGHFILQGLHSFSGRSERGLRDARSSLSAGYRQAGR